MVMTMPVELPTICFHEVKMRMLDESSATWRANMSRQAQAEGADFKAILGEMANDASPAPAASGASGAPAKSRLSTDELRDVSARFSLNFDMLTQISERGNGPITEAEMATIGLTPLNTGTCINANLAPLFENNLSLAMVQLHGAAWRREEE